MVELKMKMDLSKFNLFHVAPTQFGSPTHTVVTSSTIAGD